MFVFVIATLLAALFAAVSLPLLVLWACAESREGEPPARRSLFDFGPLRRGGLLRRLRIGSARPLLLTYRRDSRGRFRKVA